MDKDVVYLETLSPKYLCGIHFLSIPTSTCVLIYIISCQFYKHKLFICLYHSCPSHHKLYMFEIIVITKSTPITPKHTEEHPRNVDQEINKCAIYKFVI